MNDNKKQYCIGYDAAFMSPEPIEYQGRVYQGDISLFFIHHFYDENNKEVFFNETDNPKSGFCFYIDKDKGYISKYHPEYSFNQYREEITPKDATIWLNYQTPVTIPFEDGVDLLKKYFHHYDIQTNKPAQNLAYAAEKVEKR